MASVIYIEAEDVRSAWIEALKKVLEGGVDLSTEYDKEGERSSKDSTVLIKIKNPLSNLVQNRRGNVLKMQSKFGNIYEVYGNFKQNVQNSLDN